ncbi:arginase family protein [Bacillus sp. WL1]|uniref:arginase family protein n=1 Tax=unclassified Bacillus (in: firmicutes) TaxID=185979 RepID=UPI001B32C8FD|nr:MULTISPECIES: arginase family protein [unclassified Bacillus (in: firmicutes)]MBP3971293.1 arginase family protein [Bacillus sp. WL1]UOB81319.1 arginase family protein [Bacillus sp. ZJS3]
MSLLYSGLTFLNFDDTYLLQNKLHSYSHEDIDFTHLEHANLYCEPPSLLRIKQELNRRKQKGVTFIGSGNYHYVSYLLLKEIVEPFTLILFDHHTDMNLKEENEHTLISCGSWVSFALQNNPKLKKVIMIGPSSLTIHSNDYSCVEVFPIDTSNEISTHTILSHIHTNTIYVSIDKDVLDSKVTITNWDQGQMELSTLLKYIHSLIKNKNVYGIDICGELPVYPSQLFLAKYKNAIKKNEKANLQILNSIYNT